jgi:hypothetical protein
MSDLPPIYTAELLPVHAPVCVWPSARVTPPELGRGHLPGDVEGFADAFCAGAVNSRQLHGRIPLKRSEYGGDLFHRQPCEYFLPPMRQQGGV